ncbi:post-GPI attachment to proteins factor 4 [Hemitrygon akajei]|uniref:post-GPI attachment to proteins factor 4 n=1 Tax=Hemitrygon akajei TaxID=2704970 RepID=UPI003BFA143F
MPPRDLLGHPWLQLALLYLLVLGVGLPLFGADRRFSRYYQGGAEGLRRLTDWALAESLERAEEAEQYFQRPWREEEGWGEGAPELALAIVTTARRQGADHRYFLQVAAAYHRLLRLCPWCGRAQLFACNVHHPPEGHALPQRARGLIPEVRRFGEVGSPPAPEDDTFEKEKADYLFCLGRALAGGARHVLLAEDDALPHPDLFLVLGDVLGRRLRGRRPLYVKLYHPERLQGYLHPEPARLVEWAGLGAVGGSLLRWLLPARRSLGTLAALAALCMLAAELGGRVYLLELRRLTPQLYALAPASHCCTPAMAFTAEGARRAMAYLGERRCRRGYAKDTALYEAAREHGEEAYVVEPNLVTHIGLYSTLRGYIARPSL